MSYLKRRRLLKGMTGADLSRATKIHESNLYMIENRCQYLGENRKSRISKALGIRPDILDVWNKKLPKYCYEVCEDYPEELESAIRKEVRRLKAKMI